MRRRCARRGYSCDGKNRSRLQGDAQEVGEQIGTEKGGGEELRWPGMTIYGGGIRGLRRRNWAASGHDREGRQRGNAEEEEGFKGEGTGLPLLLLNAGNQAGKKRAETAMGVSPQR